MGAGASGHPPARGASRKGAGRLQSGDWSADGPFPAFPRGLGSGPHAALSLYHN